MPQDEQDIAKVNKAKGPIKKDSGKVLPREDTDIYSTGSKGNHLGVKGNKHVVHRVLAEKLVKNGFATLDEPKAGKAVTLTKKELETLETALGRPATGEEIAEAVKEKGEKA